ncbi:MAG: hypothetical protein ACOC0B_02040, partial [bacterium]
DPDTADEVVRLYYFWGEGCPVCEREAAFLDELAAEYPNLRVHRFEVWNDAENLALLEEVAARFGFEVRGVPVTVLGTRHWTGFHAGVATQVRQVLEECLADGCRDVVAEVGSGTVRGSNRSGPATLVLPGAGEVSLSGFHPLPATVIIAFVDGFNPCSLWVLTMLLALVTYTRSRTKTVLVGVTFLLVTATVYAAFISGVFSVFSFLPHVQWIRAATAVFALVFGVLSIKEYVDAGRGVSLTLSARQKGGIAGRFRSIVAGERSITGMLAITAASAAGIALVELPCTAGFPVIWSGLMSSHGVAGPAFVALLAVYLGVYLLIEIVVFVVAVFGLQIPRMGAGYARVVKLFGGTIMLALAAALVFIPDAVTSLDRTLSLLGAALGAGVVIVIINRRLPRRS